MSAFAIDVQIEKPYRAKKQVQPELLRLAAWATLQQRVCDERGDRDPGGQDPEGQDPLAETCELSVLVTGDETLHELNRRHRGVDAPTDVLAFPNEAQGPFVDAPGLKRYLGDVIISFPRAKAQAAEAGNELSAELQLLVVHGVLHLLGYDDQTGPERARMWSAQQAVLDGLGVEVHLPD